jgi:hypothetical protein
MAAIPPDAYLPQYSVEEEADPDERLKQYARNHLILRDRDPAQQLLANGRIAA